MSNQLSRRQFLLGSLAISLGIPGCYKEIINNEPIRATPPSKQSNNVRYYEKNAAEYAKYRQLFNKRIKHSPKIIAVCLNEKGVQEAVNYARYYTLPVAIKSGGHSFEGFCLNNNGLVIELSQMKAMHYDKATGIFTAQPGCKLGKIYEYLYQHRKLIPAGSCGGVGVAGLTLGGGYGLFSREYGLTCDNLLSTHMVDSEGVIHDSRRDKELLWASRGGGNGNFGVVTEFTFNTHPAPENFTSYRFKFYQLDPKKSTVIAEHWFRIMQSLPKSSYSAFVLGRSVLTILVTDTHETASSQLTAVLKQLEHIASRTYPAAKQPFLRALKRYEGQPGPLNFKNVSGGYYKDFSDLKAVFAQTHGLLRKQPGTIFQINTLGGEISNPTKEAAAAYPHRDMQFLGEIQVYWEEDAAETKAIASIQALQTLLRNHGINKHYRNYPDIDIPNWQQAYYGKNYARLQALKSRFDKDNVFRHPQSVQPKTG
ncbi:MAG: FAD/FMN-containing dehydrogenase [uncultured Thiotrichaceae bacterium]|uniref:FAD/FMN-containing dehydrogenase n=1 Tax=uncultured Thiotrichaceae bacterium TaxID=298394 RepID=A0A6S6UHV3_9GAMM|nr:MAG: FAD/FMN-containing dehydrogenase [uncultured Thiotrichaceae bacterium]